MNILAIDPGSTSTKVGVWRAGKLVKGSIEHPRPEIESFHGVMEQLDYRMERLARYLSEAGADGVCWDAVVGRGGLVRPVPSGVYLVEDALLEDLLGGVNGEHAANLGGVMAHAVAASQGVPAYVVDPPVIDEMWAVARLSGMAGIERRSMFHALNHKAVARDVARELGRDYAELNLIVVHMGGGITAGAHRKGLVVDVNNGLNGDGPFSPERTGGLPVVGVLELVEQGAFTTGELKGIVARRGGVYSYLNTVDMREVEARAQQGDAEASLVQEAMIYQIAKEIGALAAALSGAVDGIVLTGGLAFGAAVVEGVRGRVGFIAPVFVRPGEFEIEALVDGALRVLSGAEAARRYAGGTDEHRR